ncbi:MULTISPECIES: GGDEF domain-containing protein [unclassified Paenibacillus]|uniref:GGDEF domain-containing protein n=1 Tax=unclassified Paenibacillus TaxID=185978 RepID=UPI001AE2D043|nr:MULTISPECIES: GGDEF domain-containing protein [unclassified Paenibacillus]MBP1154807.1 diguanylate cyclase (GGDEF)-like protein [Paenibacillus sp. PvP091]MBP1169809.1 diguanylate cyclase (GGDEF)-like protein [Paenibacillus sp. PvR098]MBP2440837.1 diguanylate cyclase (GGDEF)-like protein [Paenibacillus sp. PvP052]
MNSLKLSDLFFGPAGPVFLHSMLIVIITMTLLVSVRLLITRRKIGYLSMVAALGIFLVQHSQLVRQALTHSMSDAQTFTALLLKLFAFVMMNIGFYQLYNATRKRDIFVFCFFGALSVVVSFTYWYAPLWLQSSEDHYALLRPLGMELYLFILIFVSFMLVNPRIGQNGKYQLMLTVYFVMHTVHMANLYLFNGSQQSLDLLERIIPFAFHIVLFLFIFERVIELMQAIYTSSITDGLTQLYNRKYFENRVRQYVQQRIPVAVIFSDIDNFKKLNDTKGHQMGDLALKKVAQIMKEETEDTGICARYGGEELVVLITDPDTSAESLSERIRSRIEAETTVTVSVGFSYYSKGITAEELIKQADEAMYQAKTTGKNKVVGS